MKTIFEVTTCETGWIVRVHGDDFNHLCPPSQDFPKYFTTKTGVAGFIGERLETPTEFKDRKTAERAEVQKEAEREKRALAAIGLGGLPDLAGRLR